MNSHSVKQTSVLIFLGLLLSFTLFGQDYPQYEVAAIADSLKENAYAVIRSQKTNIKVLALDELIIYDTSVITILDDRGLRQATFGVGYKEGFDKVKNINIVIIDAYGNVVKKIKDKEVEDFSAYDGSMAHDARYRAYTPIAVKTPFTIIATYEFYSENTIAFRSWPSYDSKTAVEFSSLQIDAYDDFVLTYKSKNFENVETSSLDFEKNKFFISNLKVPPKENYTLHAKLKYPTLMIAPKQFSYVGNSGSFDDWKSYGKWMYDLYLKDKANLFTTDVTEVSNHIEGATTNFEKAKLIYEYAVNNTRYVSIQLADGGHEPFYAKEVHSKKYGDCKALSMYTKNLMDFFDIEAYYTIVEAGNSVEKDFDPDFASLNQGNHAILTLPMNGDTIWAECTSDQTPFGHISDFTAGRRVLMINEEGGKIITTKDYNNHENKVKRTIQFEYDISNMVSNMSMDVVQSGKTMSNRLWLHEKLGEKELKEKYKDFYSDFDIVEIEVIEHGLMDVDHYKEKLSLVTKGSITRTGNYLFIPLNVFPIDIPKVTLDRSSSISIDRGYVLENEYHIIIPGGYDPGKILEATVLESEFGKYSLEEKREQNNIIISINFELKEGDYDKGLASKFNEWIEKVHALDGKKLLLNKID